MEVASDHRYQLAVAPDVLWSAIATVDDYRTWWPWLRRFDGSGLVAGDRWTCVVQPPLPYALTFTVTLEEVQAPEFVTATVGGDITGTARLEVTAQPTGSEARLVSRLSPAHPLLRAVGLVAPPLARFGHDWVLETGLRQFLSRAVEPT